MSEGDDRSLVESTLMGLSGDEATGCLTVRAAEGEYARVYLEEGRVYAVEVPGPRPVLGTRLVTLGAAQSKDVFDALDRQWADLDKWALGVLMVELGYAERDVAEQGAREYLLDGLTDLLQWKSVTCDFRPDLTTRKELVGPFEISALLTEVKARREEWSEHVTALGGPDPVLAPAGRADDDLDTVTKAVARNMRDEQRLSQLAEQCGFSLLEVARATHVLAEAGAVSVSAPPKAEPDASEADGAATAQAEGTASETENAAAEAPVGSASPEGAASPDEPAPPETVDDAGEPQARDGGNDSPATGVLDDLPTTGKQTAPAVDSGEAPNGLTNRAHKSPAPAAGTARGSRNPGPAAGS